MRTRDIKPGFFLNDQLAECSFAARLAFPGLWMVADREGRLEYRPKRLKAEIFPYDNVDMAALIDELIANKLVVRYQVEDKEYLWIPTFLEHQKPHPNEKESVIPPCPENFPLKDNPSTPELDTGESLGDSCATPRCEASTTKEIINPSSSLSFNISESHIKESSLRSDSFCVELSGDTSTRDKTGAGSISQNSPPVIALPLNTGETYPVTQDMAAKWQELYPAVDVLQQLRNMRGWLDANAARRKTRNGILKFINRWLADKQDKGGNPRASPYIPQGQPAAPTEYQKNMQKHRLMASALLAKRQERKQTEGIDAAIDTAAIRIA